MFRRRPHLEQRTGRRPALAAACLAVLTATGFAAPAAPQQDAPLRLSLADALRLALEQNLDIAVIDYDRRIARERIVAELGAFDPVIEVGTPGATAMVGSPGGGFGQAAPAAGGIGYSSSETPSTSALAGADVSRAAAFATRAQVRQRFDFGLSYEAAYDVGRSTTNSTFTSLDPSWSNNLGFAVSQPLLRGRGKEASGSQLLLAQRNRTVSEENFRAQVNGILFDVVNAYWELVFAERNMQVAESSSQLAQEQLGRTRDQVEVGMLAPVEETQAQVAVAQRRNDLILARNASANAADTLRALLEAESLPGGWETELVVTEDPAVTPRPADVDAALQAALANRPEVVAAEATIAANRVQVDKARSDLLPALDLVGSLLYQGIGGDRLVRGAFPDTRIIEVIPGGYGDALSQLFGLGFGTWRIGFNFSMPIGNHAAEGNFAQATLAEDQARAELQRIRQQTLLEVRQAARSVDDAGELMVSTRATRELAEQQLAIEQDRFEVGMSTNFEVLAFQDDLARAQVQELRAMIDYLRAEAALARVTGSLPDRYGIRIQ
jgi:outer membrane protein TolC